LRRRSSRVTAHRSALLLQAGGMNEKATHAIHIVFLEIFGDFFTPGFLEMNCKSGSKF